MAVGPHPPYFSLFPRLKIKLKGRHFHKTEAIEAESQAVLNTLTEHEFQDAFKQQQKRCHDAYIQMGTTSRMMVASRPKISFSIDGNISPGNYGYRLEFSLFYDIHHAAISWDN
jgi:hypothetical protein